MSINIKPLRYAHSEGHTGFCFTDDGRHIITCGSDGDIRVWTTFEDDEPESYCVGEGAFSVIQSESTVYVCTDDTKVIKLKYPSCERDGLLTRFTAPATHITISKNKAVLACVSEDFSVKVFYLSEGSNPVTFNELQGPALSATLTHDGSLLAVSSGDGKIYIWNLETKSFKKTIDCVPYVNNFTTASILCRTSFDPKGKFLCYPYHKEVIVVTTDTFKNICTLTSKNSKDSFSISQFSTSGKYIAASSQSGEICIWEFQSKTLVGKINHPEKHNICALEWNPQEIGQIIFCDTNGNMGAVEIPAIKNPETTEEVQEENIADLELQFPNDDDDDDNENVISLEKLKNETIRPVSAASTSKSEILSRAPSPYRPKSPVNTLQPAFQPSSTPVHLERRFLVYNEVGIIQAYNDGEPSIDIQFHDVQISRNIFMKNLLNHTMGSLSTKLIAVACEAPSKLVCIPTEANNKQWTIEMTELEEIFCVAASSKLVAVATDLRYLRVFSICGIQLAVLSSPGPVVAITAHDSKVLLVYHATTAYSKDQNLCSMLVTFEGFNLQCKYIPIPLTPESTLTWVGFSDRGSICTYDSAGILRQHNTRNNFWIPIFNASLHAKGASDSYFITSVNESLQTVSVIHCKGTLYPATTPRPILIDLPMQTLLCEMDSDKSQLEDKIFRWSQTQIDNSETMFKEAVIKLFVLACKTEQDERALELLSLINSIQLTNLALKYASRLNRKRLVEKLTELLNHLQNKEDSEDENNENSNVSSNRTLLRRSNVQNKTIDNENCSQDLFTQTPIQSPQINTQDITLSNKTKGVNPFLKKKNEAIKRNPLGLAEMHNDSQENISQPKNDVTDKIENKKETNTSAKTETFASWFSNEKSNLESKHPELSPLEITQMALKLFKSNSEKRKAADEAEGNRNKQQKLSAFAFSKNR